MILVLRAGDPVEAVAARRGPFSTLIREAVGDAWRGGQGEWREHDIRTGDVGAAFPSLKGVACIIITGSSANVPDRLPWMLRTEAFLRDAANANVAMLGLCFGHQILAQALGGNVIKNPRGREIGTTTLTLDAAAKDDPWLASTPTTFATNFSHIDTVERLPAGARRLGTSPKDDNAIFAIGASIRGVQFHPEFDADVMGGYVSARSEAIDAEGLNSAEIARAVCETPFARALLPGFLRNFI